jgi:hypothetical protein
VNHVINQSGKPSGNDLVARVPKEQLKSLFYLFSGKPDSRIKTFEDAVQISKQDILELHDSISAKLATHDIDAVIATVKVGYEGSQLSEFGTWAEFSEHSFIEPEKVEEIVVKWDFLVSVREYANPQRHTVLFRVSREMKPSQLFHMLGAGNHDELDQVDVMSCPAFCRVDFINAQISKELINLVSDWYSGRKEPELIEPVLYKLKKHKNVLATVLDQWLLFSWAMLIASFFYWKSNTQFGGNPPFGLSAIALFLAIYSLRPVSRVAVILVGRIYKAISDLEGSRVVFEFTPGDRKRIAQQKKENAKQGRKFVVASCWNVALNIAATILYTWLFAKGNV